MTAIPPPLPELIGVEPLFDRWLRLTFAAGDPASPVVRQYDVDPWLSKGVFRALRDPLLFRQAFIQHGTVCWPGNLDIDPECLWSQSVPWPEPVLCVGVRPTGRSGSSRAAEAAAEVSLAPASGTKGPPIPLLTVVATLRPVPGGGGGASVDLPRGTIGTVVEPLGSATCLVEFAGEDGVSVAETLMRYDELLPVSWVASVARDLGVASLKGTIRPPPSPVSVDDMAAAGPAKAVADMQAFFEEGQALAQVSPSSASGSSDDLYETDSEGWAKLQIQLLQAENWAELDVGNLIEVLERVAALVRVLRTELGGEPPKDKPSLAQFILEMPEGAPLELDAEAEEQPGPAGRHLHEKDLVLWATLQSQALRDRRTDLLDWHHLAAEIHDVAEAERRELGQLVVNLMASLTTAQGQPPEPGTLPALREQRRQVWLKLEQAPSLRVSLRDAVWLDTCWSAAVAQLGADGADVAALPVECPWSVDGLLLSLQPEAEEGE